jgi:hypothetical protein
LQALGAMLATFQDATSGRDARRRLILLWGLAVDVHFVALFQHKE